MLARIKPAFDFVNQSATVRIVGSGPHDAECVSAIHQQHFARHTASERKSARAYHTLSALPFFVSYQANYACASSQQRRKLKRGLLASGVGTLAGQQHMPARSGPLRTRLACRFVVCACYACSCGLIRKRRSWMRGRSEPLSSAERRKRSSAHLQRCRLLPAAAGARLSCHLDAVCGALSSRVGVPRRRYVARQDRSVSPRPGVYGRTLGTRPLE